MNDAPVEDDDFEDTQWTDASRRQVAENAEALIAAIRAHADAIIGAQTEDVDTVFDADEALVAAAVAYSDASFDLTGSTPFGLLDAWDDDDEDDDDADSDELAAPTEFVTVLQRADYAVVDADAIVEAAIQAFAAAYSTSREAAEDRINHLGAALYTLADFEGWDSLARADGLTPLGGLVRVVRPTANPAPEGDYEDIDVEGETLYTQEDRFA